MKDVINSISIERNLTYSRDKKRGNNFVLIYNNICRFLPTLVSAKRTKKISNGYVSFTPWCFDDFECLPIVFVSVVWIQMSWTNYVVIVLSLHPVLSLRNKNIPKESYSKCVQVNVLFCQFYWSPFMSIAL